MVRKSGGSSPTMLMKSTRSRQALGDPPRRVVSIAIAVEQQRRHHRRIERRLPALDAVDTLDLFQIDPLDHQVQDEPRQVILVELLNRRRQQHRFIDLPGAIALAHEQAESDSPPRRQQNPRFLRQAPSSSISKFESFQAAWSSL